MTTPMNPSFSDELAQRKGDHIELASKAQTSVSEVDTRFYYEPLFFKHPDAAEKWAISFLGKELFYPVWISSMTGGAVHAQTINQNLAKLAGKYHLGMGLGSCRALLDSDEHFSDFNVRKELGDGPLLTNLGVAQVEELVLKKQTHKIHDVVKKLSATGLLIHINPLQEWFQPEGDRYTRSPLETISRFLETASYPVMVKEVGQGFGPRSLEVLLKLPIAGIEFGAFGGTNFSLLESLRQEGHDHKRPFTQVGHTAREMVSFLNKMEVGNKEFIISGGQKNILDAFELQQTLMAPSVLGFAQAFLKPAMESFESLEKTFLDMRESLLTAKKILELKDLQ